MSYNNGAGLAKLLATGDYDGIQKYLNSKNPPIETFVLSDSGANVFHLAAGNTDPALRTKLAQIIRLLASRWPQGIDQVSFFFYWHFFFFFFFFFLNY